jgi:cytochrome c oxidase assembly protein subunit 11
MSAKNRNASVALSLLTVACGMLMLAYASVPLYRLFCQATGFGGVAQASRIHPHADAKARLITVRFDANVSPQLDWTFYPEKREITVHVGEESHIDYIAQSHMDSPTTGTATFNVLPVKAGIYFNKIQCFCFTKQTLAAHAKRRMGVTFFVDPAIGSNPDTNDVRTITLSYTFFPVDDKDR